MTMVLLTALGVGGATIVGALIGFIFRKLSHKFSDIVLSFAAGVMMAAAVLGLVIPAVEYGTADYGIGWGLLIACAGIFAGALCLNLVDKLVPHLHNMMGADIEQHQNGQLKPWRPRWLSDSCRPSVHTTPFPCCTDSFHYLSETFAS